MKKLLYTLPFVLAFIFSGHKAEASHMAGGEIWYVFTGDSLHPYKYRVYLQFYRDITGISAPANPRLCIKSGCYNNFDVPFTFLPFSVGPNSDTTLNGNGSIMTPNLNECVPAASVSVQTEVYRFYADITLPGPCSDWTFGFNESARNSNDNLSSAGTFYIEAVLNNTLGPNSSPVFVNPAAKAFCVGSPFVWSQAAIEPDGDSLYYDFGIPLTSNIGCPATPTPISFAPGYTRAQPMKTFNGINIDHKNGTFTFTPSNVEVDVINVVVQEYRQDPTAPQFWLHVGTSVRDLQVPIEANCKTTVAGGPKLNLNASGFSSQPIDKDSILDYLHGLGLARVKFDSSQVGGSGLYNYSMGVIEYNCYDDVIPITFDIDVLCESIDPTGKDFRLVGPDSVPRPVVGVSYNCKTDLTVRNVALQLHKPLDKNGHYYLQIKKGDDGNTLTNRCGFELQDYYTMIIEVNNCPDLDYRMENVTVQGDTAVRLDWYADSTSFSTKLFTEWRILRSNNGSQFYQLKAVDDVNARSFVDDNMDPQSLDAMQFSYAIQLRQNYDYRPPTNIISNILLQDSLYPDSSAFELQWTPYNGWSNNDTLQADKEYEVFIARYDSSQSGVPNWVNFEGPKENFFNTTYNFPPEDMLEDSAGTYVMKVEATPVANPINLYKSESNWIYFVLEFDPEDPDIPQEPQVPNVFTPNGDLQNDRFYVGNVDAYMGEGDLFSVAVYNRWGKKVFEDPDYREDNNDINGWNGTDMNSNSKVADGVYYYVISLKDSETGKTEDLKGQLNIFSAGTY